MAHMNSRNKMHNITQKFVAQHVLYITFVYICMYWSEIVCIVSAISTDVFDNVIEYLLYCSATFVIANCTCIMILVENVYCIEQYLWSVWESYC
jgi:hypothetical protein